MPPRDHTRKPPRRELFPRSASSGQVRHLNLGRSALAQKRSARRLSAQALSVHWPSAHSHSARWRLAPWQLDGLRSAAREFVV